MRILAIETSCDETSLALAELADGVLHTDAHLVLSQAQKHAVYGGVFPTLAKREHARTLSPLLQELTHNLPAQAVRRYTIDTHTLAKLKHILEREPELFVRLAFLFKEHPVPSFEAIAVTVGPGLAPALWVGVNFARALSVVTSAPILPVNHMEGHLYSALLAQRDSDTYSLTPLRLPALALLISGGHTQLVSVTAPHQYSILGETKDDAVGEAFDKVARMLGLPYPGGPAISTLAQEARAAKLQLDTKFPRPMLHDAQLSFSFSGLKTAVLYYMRELTVTRTITDDDKKRIARAFEEAVAEVLTVKLKRALEQTGARQVLIAGGVAANTFLHTQIKQALPTDVSVHMPPRSLTGDNALMIALAALLRQHNGQAPIIGEDALSLSADANWRIDTPWNNRDVD